MITSSISAQMLIFSDREKCLCLRRLNKTQLSVVALGKIEVFLLREILHCCTEI